MTIITIMTPRVSEGDQTAGLRLPVARDSEGACFGPSLGVYSNRGGSDTPDGMAGITLFHLEGFTKQKERPAGLFLSSARCFDTSRHL